MKFIVVLLACVLVAEGKNFGIFGEAITQSSSQDELTTVRPTRLPIPTPVSTAKPTIELSSIPPRPTAINYPATNYPGQVKYIPSNDGFAKTIQYKDEIIDNDGRHYFFETSNGIIGQAKLINYGNPPQTSIAGEGYFSWTSPEGKFVEVHYTADKNGYQPTGDAIPVVSAQFARALEYAARYTAGIKH